MIMLFLMGECEYEKILVCLAVLLQGFGIAAGDGTQVKAAKNSKVTYLDFDEGEKTQKSQIVTLLAEIVQYK